MFEKVSKFHPDKCADRLAGAITDLVVQEDENARVAVEVLAGHGVVNIIIETTANDGALVKESIEELIHDIYSDIKSNIVIVPQDPILSGNQEKGLCAGDNGIFVGKPTSNEEKLLTEIVKTLDEKFGSDGKCVISETENGGYQVIVCQSNANEEEINEALLPFKDKSVLRFIINPLGDWSGGINVDAGATNRKIGSDMGRAATGGGLHGKDYSKSDLSVNVVCHIFAQETNLTVKANCAIGDDKITFIFSNGMMKTLDYPEIVAMAKNYIKDNFGGRFSKFAEYGLIN